MTMQEKEKSRFSDVALPESEQSTLEQFVQHAVPYRPNELHEVGQWLHQREKKQKEPKRSGSADNCIAPSARNARAERSGELRGALSYTRTENTAKNPRRVEESDESVVSRMNSKEEFPQG